MYNNYFKNQPIFNTIIKCKELITWSLPLLYVVGYVMQTISYGRMNYSGLELFNVRYLLTGVITVSLLIVPVTLFLTLALADTNDKNSKVSRVIISIFILVLPASYFLVIILHSSGLYSVNIFDSEIFKYLFEDLNTKNFLWNVGIAYLIPTIILEPVESFNSYNFYLKRILIVTVKLFAVALIISSSAFLGRFWDYDFLTNDFNLPQGSFIFFITAWFVLLSCVSSIGSIIAKSVKHQINDFEEEGLKRFEDVYFKVIILIVTILPLFFYIALIWLPLIPKNLGGTEPTYCKILLTDKSEIEGYLINNINDDYYLIGLKDSSEIIKLSVSQVKSLTYDY